MSQPKIDYPKIKVLVIDDQQFIRSIIVRFLRYMGVAQIAEAKDGETALRSCKEFAPDIAFCDIDMTPMNGLTFLKELRRSTDIPRARTLPVIMLTSHNESNVVMEARASGIDAFLVKPVSQKAVTDRFDWVVAKHYKEFVKP